MTKDQVLSTFFTREDEEDDSTEFYPKGEFSVMVHGEMVYSVYFGNMLGPNTDGLAYTDPDRESGYNWDDVSIDDIEVYELTRVDLSVNL